MKEILLISELTGQMIPVSMLDINVGDDIKVIDNNSAQTFKVELEDKLKTGGESMKTFVPIH